ncbi:MAG: hypothetical protein ACLPH3_22105 [Terracidiphilus sp.]
MSIGMANLDGALQVKIGTLFGRELILISQSTMEVQTWFFCFMIEKRKFNNELVRQFRYEEWTEKGIRTCGIRFKYDGKTQVLVKTLLNESTSLRTVVRIINVYRFSHTVPADLETQLTGS